MSSLRAAWRGVDAALALLLLAVMVAELAAKAPIGAESATTPVAYVWAALITLPIALHRRYPVAAVLVAAAGIVGYATGHFTAFPGYAAFAMVFVVSLHCGRGRGLLSFGAMAAALGVSLAMQTSPTVTPSTWVMTLLVLAVAWLAGDNLRVRRQRWEALRARARRLEEEREERARQAVTEERLRIARELHDVVAHAMSVIAVQAGVANHVIDSRPELARQALGTVETHTRAALVEMRRLLGVLRQEGEPSASLTPSPGLAEVSALVSQFVEAGLQVEMTVTGEAVAPDGVELSAYRIVQEGLTNVLRHGGPKATVAITREPGLVTIGIGDDGRPTRSGGKPGHGLVGMRERVAVFGGTLTAQPRPGGGFDLTATLPYGAAA
ncbi:sensor histidine kinase [Actinoplanes sp. NPDC051633]|uniref:sensor histidine kinase n=1 Tax=Actinoplanes sp. NPDC051633 TaxID=3155670 RepID=UPI003422B90B